jgi:hypothetical protein
MGEFRAVADDTRGFTLGGRPVAEFSYSASGPMLSDYFQGAGVCGTDWDDVYVGHGSSAAEAMAEAVDDAASAGWDVTKIRGVRLSKRVPAECRRSAEVYIYVALYVRGEEEKCGSHGVAGCVDCDPQRPAGPNYQ